MRSISAQAEAFETRIATDALTYFHMVDMVKLEEPWECYVDSDEKILVTQNRLSELELPFTVRLTPPRASDEMTARFHCAIRCLARQLKWAGEKLSEEDWKRLIVATVCGQRVIPSIDGKGFVVLDRQTRTMSGAMKSDLTEFIYAWGAERGVVFDDE